MRENSAIATLEIDPPAGAELVDNWELDPVPHRDVFGRARTVTDHEARVYSTVVQLDDGSIDRGGFRRPAVFVANGENWGLGPLNSDQARELAAALLEGAAEIDRWAGR